ncbi:GIY-YIG nuclease family protein [Rhodanobacter soli]
MPITYMPGSGRSRFCVYHLVNPANGLPFYIGFTDDPRDRMKSHRKGNIATAEGCARHAVITALVFARLPMTMEIHRTFPYRGQAMGHESATIKGMLGGDVPILNSSKRSLESRLATHLAAIMNCAAIPAFPHSIAADMADC